LCVWQTSNKQKKYAFFPATVVASASEQENGFLEKSQQKIRHIPLIENTDRVIVGADELPPPDQKDLDPGDKNDNHYQ
jgi:hypothetical protein